VRLGDLAQVVPKGGRTLQVLVGDQDYVKAVSSAIQGANLSLTPQPDSQNALQLNIAVPPPTKESRMAEMKNAQAAGERASIDIRNARQAHQKKMKAMHKLVPEDDLRKAAKEMDKIVEKGQGEVKKMVEGAKKALEQA